MAFKLKKGGLGAAPGKSGTPEKPKKEKATKEKSLKKGAKVEDIAPDVVGNMTHEELQELIAQGTVNTLATIFAQLVGVEPVVDTMVDGDEDGEEVEEVEEEEEAPAPKKAAKSKGKGKGKKKAEPVVAEEEDDDEDEPDDDDSGDDDDTGDDDPEPGDYDPNPFPKDKMEIAEEAVAELDNDPKEQKAILKAYLESAPQDCPATVKIAKLVQGKKLESAWQHLVCLLVDDEGNVNDFESAYLRNEEFVYLGGVEGIPVDDTGFAPVKGAKLVSLADGEETKAPKTMKLSQILFNPVRETYFGLNKAQDSIVEVEAEDA